MASVNSDDNNTSSNEDNVINFGNDEVAPVEITPEDPMLADMRLKLSQVGEKRKELLLTSTNLITRAISEIANSSDFIETQKAIYAFETGFTPLYRVLDKVVKLGDQIVYLLGDKNKAGQTKSADENKEDRETVFKAFSDLEKVKKDGLGIVNIGKAKLPKVNDAFIDELKANPCPKLIDFLFSSADPSTRSDYRKITSWAQRHDRHNFVDWISNEIVYDGVPTADNTSGIEKCGKGIKGAVKFVRCTEQTEAASISIDKSALDYAKEICEKSNAKLSMPKPEWLSEKENDKGEPATFMILATVKGGELTVYDVTDGDKRTYENAIKQRHSSHFATVFDQKEENRGAIVEQVQNIIKLISAPELLIWQDQYATYLMPIYPTWLDGKKNVIPCKEESQYCIVLQFQDIGEKDSEFDATFPITFGGESGSELPHGFSTTDVKKIRSYKGPLEIEWVGRNMLSFKSMGVSWEKFDPKAFIPGKAEPNGLMRYISAKPVGFDYVRMAIFSSAYIVSENIDFARAKKEFSKWKDLQYAKTSSYARTDVDILIAVENGIIGVWFYPIKAKKTNSSDPDTYNYEGNFVQIGTTTHNLLRGKWLIPEKRIERIWNFISHPWELLIPDGTEDYTIGEGDKAYECLSYDDALVLMVTNPEQTYRADSKLTEQEVRDLHYDRLINLCSDKEAGTSWVEEQGVWKGEYPEDKSIRKGYAHLSKVVDVNPEQQASHNSASAEVTPETTLSTPSFRVACEGEKGKRLVLPLVLKCGGIWLTLPTK